ncbi:hypothetical protein BT96DRAFT_991215 [Gymnopus androsaceus JB14]|uniref:Uncharacterized protein n=1 Tax=Gymnopus androsaceus JB14 TaxID=1447944 RepID=A0A6A4I0E3_9AGAR|nr:hypothetical protein BT96DRAFT_991215 [Gymnopus androsaceus JB14]
MARMDVGVRGNAFKVQPTVTDYITLIMKFRPFKQHRETFPPSKTYHDRLWSRLLYLRVSRNQDRLKSWYPNQRANRRVRGISAFLSFSTSIATYSHPRSQQKKSRSEIGGHVFFPVGPVDYLLRIDAALSSRCTSFPDKAKSFIAKGEMRIVSPSMNTILIPGRKVVLVIGNGTANGTGYDEYIAKVESGYDANAAQKGRNSLIGGPGDYTDGASLHLVPVQATSLVQQALISVLHRYWIILPKRSNCMLFRPSLSPIREAPEDGLANATVNVARLNNGHFNRRVMRDRDVYVTGATAPQDTPANPNVRTILRVFCMRLVPNANAGRNQEKNMNTSRYPPPPAGYPYERSSANPPGLPYPHSQPEDLSGVVSHERLLTRVLRYTSIKCFEVFTANLLRGPPTPMNVERTQDNKNTPRQGDFSPLPAGNFHERTRATLRSHTLVRAHSHSQVLWLIPVMGEDVSATPHIEHLLDTPRVSAYGSRFPTQYLDEWFLQRRTESKQRGLPADLRDIAPPPDAALVIQHVLDHQQALLNNPEPVGRAQQMVRNVKELRRRAAAAQSAQRGAENQEASILSTQTHPNRIPGVVIRSGSDNPNSRIVTWIQSLDFPPVPPDAPEATPFHSAALRGRESSQIHNDPGRPGQQQALRAGAVGIGITDAEHDIPFDRLSPWDLHTVQDDMDRSDYRTTITHPLPEEGQTYRYFPPPIQRPLRAPVQHDLRDYRSHVHVVDETGPADSSGVWVWISPGPRVMDAAASRRRRLEEFSPDRQPNQGNAIYQPLYREPGQYHHGEDQQSAHGTISSYHLRGLLGEGEPQAGGFPTPIHRPPTSERNYPTSRPNPEWRVDQSEAGQFGVGDAPMVQPLYTLEVPLERHPQLTPDHYSLSHSQELNDRDSLFNPKQHPFPQQRAPGAPLQQNRPRTSKSLSRADSWPPRLKWNHNGPFQTRPLPPVSPDSQRFPSHSPQLPISSTADALDLVSSSPPMLPPTPFRADSHDKTVIASLSPLHATYTALDGLATKIETAPSNLVQGRSAPPLDPATLDIFNEVLNEPGQMFSSPQSMSSSLREISLLWFT